jgi:hypothetical protein
MSIANSDFSSAPGRSSFGPQTPGHINYPGLGDFLRVDDIQISGL